MSPFHRLENLTPFGSRARRRLALRTLRNGGSRRPGTQLRGESLERRAVLAVAAFSFPNVSVTTTSTSGGGFGVGGLGGVSSTTKTTPGWVTIVSDQADDVYLQQVTAAAGGPKYPAPTLLYADNSSFVNARAISNIDGDYKTIYVTNGQAREDRAIQFNNYPMYDVAAKTTRFRLNHGGLYDDLSVFGYRPYAPSEIFGLIRCVQPDGQESSWTFTDWNGSRRAPIFSHGAFRITSGPGYGDQDSTYVTARDIDPANQPNLFGTYQPFQSLPAGYVYPTAVFLRNNGGSGARASLEVVWSAVLTPGNAPSVTARYDSAGVQTSVDVAPSAPVNSTFVLPNASGAGSLGIVPGTLSGTVGAAFKPRELKAKDYPEGDLNFGQGSRYSGAATADGTVTISFSPLTVTSLAGFGGQAGAIGGGGGLGVVTRVLPEDPGPLTLSATYAVYVQDVKPNSLTFFAGHDITREISTELLTPGSTINVDSPLVMGSLNVETSSQTGVGLGGFGLGGLGLGLVTTTTSEDLLADGKVELRATNINVDAVVKANQTLIVGNPLDAIPDSGVVKAASRLATQRNVSNVVADVSGGKVTGISIPTGFAGVGYDADRPPTVTIAAPQPLTATARVTAINGKVYDIPVTNGGGGYTTAPTVTISPPDLAGGIQATALAIVQNGAVQRIDVTNVGSGYSQAPTVTLVANPGAAGAVVGQGATAVARIRGPITAIRVVDRGLGYTSGTPPQPVIPAVLISGGNGRAAATAVVSASGEVAGIVVTDGGDDYSLDGSTTVSVAAPPTAGGTTAQAQAIFDASGTRIIGFKVTDAGLGYGLRPVVTVSAATPLAAATPGTAILVGGKVKSIAVPVTQRGYGYPTAPAVWIAPPARTSGGTQAVASAFIDEQGQVIGITMSDEGSGYDEAPVVYIAPPYPVAETETVKIDGAVAAQRYDIRLANDLDTPETDRALLVVSATGSLGGALNGDQAADALFLQAQQADIWIEGQVNADGQTWLLQSPAAASDLAPFTFATRSASTGVNSGLIRGETVAITLGNDAPTPKDRGAVAFNVVDLATRIDSFRIRAATSKGVTRNDPFPYVLTVNERDNISFDAVAASSFPISLAAGGNIAFTAALATAGDLAIRATDNLTVRSPISTTLGTLNFSGTNLSVGSSLQVLNAAADETRNDIVLSASNGDVRLDGLVKATNNVRISQKNRTGPSVVRYRNTTPLAISDLTTVTQAIAIGDDFTFDNVDVELDIAHTYVGDLSAALIAPDGTRIRLFTRIGGSGDNFTGTILDSEATTPIGAGTAPFTGAFRPEESLAPLYGRSVLGTWRLEVRDNAGSDTGVLNNFALAFRNTQLQPGKVYGNGRVVTDRLAVRSEGSVGNPGLFPVDTGFFLRTDVNRLDAVVRDSVSIDEASALTIDSLSARGLVSLRVNGNDGAPAKALTGTISDLTALDVSVPNGSIDVTLNSSTSIVLGNATALRNGKAFSMLAGGDVRLRSLGGSIRGEITALDAPLAGSGARSVRGKLPAVLSVSAQAVYDPKTPGTFASTLTAKSNGTLSIPSVANLRVGERILVASTDPSLLNANGIYTVTSLGSATTRWSLSRASDSDTGAELPTNTFVRVTDGATGDVGIYQLTWSAGAFARTPIAVTAKQLVTNIGSEDPNDATTFVVATTGGDSLAAGSLGKMIRLRQENADQPGPMDLRFSSQINGPVQLTEELPTIVKSFVIDGSRRYTPAGGAATASGRIFVDGSLITRTNTGAAVVAGSEVNGFSFAVGASGGIISNLSIAGFTRGSAVKVQGASQFLVDHLTLGLNAAGDRLANKYGITVGGSSGDVTLSGNTIASSSEAGILVGDSAARVALVGNTVGVLGRENKLGVNINSTGTGIRIGVDPVGSTATIPTVQATRVKLTATTFSTTSFTLPASFAANTALLVPGVQVRGPGIRPTTELGARVLSVAINATTKITTVTIADGAVTNDGQVAFGYFANMTKGGTALTLPAILAADRVYLGQSISGTGIAAGTTITRISGTQVTLSAPMVADGVYSVTLGSPARNTVQYNLTGMWLANGVTAVTNTSVVSSVFDGVRVSGGTATIGRSAARTTSSNVIAANGGWGIVFEGNDLVRARAFAASQTVRGNYLGLTSSGVAAVTQINKGGNIGVRVGDSGSRERYDGPVVGGRGIYVPISGSGNVDASGNQHNTGVSTPGGTGGGGKPIGTGGIR